MLKRDQLTSARLLEKYQRLGFHFAFPKRQKLLSIETLQFIYYKHARHKTHEWLRSERMLLCVFIMTLLF